MLTIDKKIFLQGKISTSQNNFNFVRLLLALAVVFFHAQPLFLSNHFFFKNMGFNFSLGEFAVGIFFFLSGLFVTQSWLKNPHVATFFLRRILRIFPGLAVCVCSTTLIAVCFFSEQGFSGLGEINTWSYIVNNVFVYFLQSSIFQNSLRIPGVFSYLSESAINGPLWTLLWEGRFYVALGILGMSAVTPSKYWFTFIGGLLLIYVGFDTDLSPLKLKYSLWESKLLVLFVCGMIVCTLADLVAIKWETVFCIVLYLALNYRGAGEFGIYLIGCALALWVGSLNIQIFQWCRTHDYSYSIYIYHFPIIQMLKKFYPENGSNYSLFFYTILLLFPISYISWRFIEKPSIDMGSKVIQNQWVKKLPFFKS
jgi:peptidoglycan/LPS O-acetylase OafA/YrhL